MKQPIQTDHAPQAIGPYSQAIKVGGTLYFSGQIPLDPKTMQLISNDFREQAIQTFENLQEVATAAGADMNNIVKLTIYLVDLKHFSVVNEVMTQFFKEPYPARTTIQVSALPKAAQIEVDAILVI